MKVGDLVMMKRRMVWNLKVQHQQYTEQPMLIVEIAYNAVKMLDPSSGKVVKGLQESYNVISVNEIQ